jgi:DMSO/TMAO reductase YedYZ molybdopterin-dependent catalytic subunit
VSANNIQYNLQITSLFGATINLTYDDILALPKTTVSADLSCYGNSVTSGDWLGVKLADLLNQAGIDPAAASIDFKAQDGYAVSIPIDTAMRPDVIVAYDLNGSPLAETLRLVVPDANGNIWIAMITSISMSTGQLSQGVSGNNELKPFEQYQSSTNITTQPSQQQQPQIQPTPTASSNKTIVEPVAPPANVTQPQSEQKASGQQGLNFPVEAVYWVLFGIVVAVVAVSFVVYSRKKTKV